MNVREIIDRIRRAGVDEVNKADLLAVCEALKLADTWILQHSERALPDHACAQCVPGGESVVAGFTCAVHAAKGRQRESS